MSCPIHSYLGKSLQEGLGTYMSLVSLLLLPCGGEALRSNSASAQSLL